MKLASFIHNNQSRIGQVIGDRVHAAAWTDTMQHLIRRGISTSRTSDSYALDQVRLAAPVRPSKIIAIGRNYAEHAAETGSEIPKAPIIFAKFPSSIIGPGEPITWSESVTREVDWEGELAVVIGRRARNVPEDAAYDHVFGYTIANDVSARDLQLRQDAQWTRGKSLDSFCPVGPWIVTRDEIPDPHNLHITTTVSGQVMQDGQTSHMMFSIPALIAYCSRMFTLEPGDLLLSGTPPGVGEGRKPPVYLKDGDVVTIAIEGIGELTNPCKVLDG